MHAFHVTGRWSEVVTLAVTPADSPSGMGQGILLRDQDPERKGDTQDRSLAASDPDALLTGMLASAG